MAESASLRVDEVLPEQRIRQWVPGAAGTGLLGLPSDHNKGARFSRCRSSRSGKVVSALSR